MISFLIAIHNEEKLIGKVLENLTNLPCDKEIIVGLDGCTDNSENIVRSYGANVKFCKLDLRQGKAAVINKIVQQASGEIIVIHDADWIFKADKESLSSLINVFSNTSIGGIADAFPIQYPLRFKAGMLERGIMIQNKLWMDYNKKHSGPLLVNILRRSLYKPSETLADDFERYYNILDNGCYVVFDENLPRMITIGEDYTFKGLIRQKERTALARKQVSFKMGWKFYFYVLGKCFTMGLKNFIAFSIVNLAFIIGTIKSKFKKPISTQEGWQMRAR